MDWLSASRTAFAAFACESPNPNIDASHTTDHFCQYRSEGLTLRIFCFASPEGDYLNSDGEGFSVKLDLIPLDGADIVIRTPREEQARNEQEGGAS